MRDLKHLDKLENYLKARSEELLEESGITYERIDEWPEPIPGHFMDRHQIVVYKDGVRIWDVICHEGSYGCDEGLLEGMGTIFTQGDVEGWLTADDVIRRIEECGK